MTESSVIKYLLAPDAPTGIGVAMNLMGLETAESEPVEVKVIKAHADDDQRLVYGIVLRPSVVDGHLDIMTPEEVQKTAHYYMAVGGIMGDGHVDFADAIPVESYIAPVDFEINGQQVVKGDWVLVSLVVDDDLWAKIKSGEVTAYSPGGLGAKIAI